MEIAVGSRTPERVLVEGLKKYGRLPKKVEKTDKLFQFAVQLRR